jgi:methylthioribose-1-phosphate isomerase
MECKHSPLFVPVVWQGDRLKVLDETLLPWKTEYVPVHDAAEALRVVKAMKTRAFGQVLTFLYTMALVAQGYKEKNPEPLRERLVQLAAEFTQARPTFDFKGLTRFFPDWFRELPSGADVGSWIRDKALAFAARIIKAREERAKRTAELLPNPCTLLTHCNISGELVAVAQFCAESGKELRVIATETRPYLQGSRLTAWELAQGGVPVALIPDSAVAQVFAKGEVNAVLVGSDRCAQNGDIINKVGTYPLAVVAKEYGIPFYALVQEPGSAAQGEDIPIEERPASELLTFQGRSLAPEGADKIVGRYPAFDITPAALISRLIDFGSSWTPEEFRKRFENASRPTERDKKGKRSFLLLYGIPKAESYRHLAQVLRAEQAEAVLVPEMRPELRGARVVARELVARNIPATLISDNMMGTFFGQGQIRRLYLFYTELGEKGPVGICGSLLAVLLAHVHGVPIELLAAEKAGEGPLDRDVTTFLGERVLPEGVAIFPIQKEEVVPWSLFKDNRVNSS